MHSKKRILTNFSRAVSSQSFCLRPDNEQELTDYVIQHPSNSMLVRGSGVSYNDSCFNSNSTIIDSSRLNHLISFNPDTGIAICQGGVSFKDLFLLHPEFIPPVLPGTVHATIAGGIAHDVHGKNNHKAGSFGQHVVELELLIGNKKFYCSREEHGALFHATIAGLGLTGIITRIAVRLKKASRFVHVAHQHFESIRTLIEHMSTQGINSDYQVAWLDLLHATPRSILSTANYCESLPQKEYKIHTVPKFPLGLIKAWNMKLFNRYFFNTKKAQEQLGLEQFNNPLDKIMHWNRLYGPKGLIQFQAVFDKENAAATIEHLIQLINTYKATPTLAVLKLFTQNGEGLLSFCKPGFTLAIDFINNSQAKQAIAAMNEWITEINGRIYLAKDMILTEEQYKKMYDHQEQFSQILNHYGCTMHSDLAKRLGIKK